ncbi:acyl-CoA N-acyltransferase [Ramaria rubella]|nr:acyl-CoA N-acyltransferase [Ramaria rubella]
MSKWPPIALKSPWGRVVLTRPSPEDDEATAALRSDPETLRYIPFHPPMTVEQCRALRETRAASAEVWDFSMHLTSLLPSAKSPSPQSPSQTFAGYGGLTFLDLSNRTGEAGIMVVPSLYRTGLATETFYMILAHAFEYPGLQLHRMQFRTTAENVRMRGWLEGCGVPVEYRMREVFPNGRGGRMDVLGYSVLEGEWPALKAKLEERLTALLGPAVVS